MKKGTKMRVGGEARRDGTAATKRYEGGSALYRRKSNLTHFVTLLLRVQVSSLIQFTMFH